MYTTFTMFTHLPTFIVHQSVQCTIYTHLYNVQCTPTWPHNISLYLQEPLKILQPLHLVVEVPERGLLALQDLVDDFLLHWVLRLRLNLLEEERDLHDMMDGRHQEVGQLEFLTARVLVTPLNRECSVQSVYR